ncbi:hypothetical protein [Yinghuangia sp. YIM S09857]|uniref:hypothetical protein n=1 Tax=Yinghuangia sp. YIM S09857 TaxID=3436929 RepID=UPI003F536182
MRLESTLRKSPDTVATKVVVSWSQEAPAQIAEALRGPFVTGLRIRPGTKDEEADTEYWDDVPDFEDDGTPMPPPPHGDERLADLDLGGLRELELSYFRIGDTGARHLATAISRGRTETLDLRYCGIGDEGLDALVRSGHLDDVRRLRLQHNRFGAVGVRALAHLRHVEELDLRYNRIGAEGAQALAEAAFADRLRILHLHRRDVSDAGVRILASAARLPAALRCLWGEHVSVELRDLFLALASSAASEAEVERCRAKVDATEAEPTAVIDGLAVCWHPSARFTALRFVEAARLEQEVDGTTRDLFARPSDDAPHLAAVFADPRELSFRTFENIVPLDRFFTDMPSDVLSAGTATELAPGAYVTRLEVSDECRARLMRLDDLNLYVPPLNSVSRGGERFIFHSAVLADALGRAVKAALPDDVLDGFSHVNPVFRANRFRPGDGKFRHHLDTPYYDRARGHVSRYTVLLYLTGGTGEPALRLTDLATLTDIEAFTCVVFDQSRAHEGAAYRDGDKVFLRTELIFHQSESDVAHDPDIGALFAKACYLTGESVFAPELAPYADTYFNQVAAAHWNGLPGEAASVEPFVHKRFRGVDFVANGHDFWFAKSEGLSLAACAAITLLDYFNCTLGGTPFRDVCETSVIEARGTDWVTAFLRERRGERGRAASEAVPEFDKAVLFPAAEETDDSCCPFHSWADFEATRFSEVVELNDAAQSFAKAHILPAPILLLGQEVVLDPDKFVIRGNQIHVLGKEPLAPVNFAACWNSGGRPANYLDIAATVEAVHLLVPPILFSETDDCHHLNFDFFRNTWTLKHRQLPVPVPRIRDLEELDFDPDGWDPRPEPAVAFPWLEAVYRSVADDLAGEPSETPWWTDESPLGEDLREHLLDIEDEYQDLADEMESDEEEDEED